MRADVREANTASRRVFRRLGWQEAENADGRVEFSWSTAAGGVGESR
jgi:RimJ/RimL family protein N-acetyltransferase